MTVEYKPIPGYPGYRAGDDGTIWSCWVRCGAYGQHVLSDEWLLLTPDLNNKDLKARYNLKHISGTKHKRSCAYFVLLAFVGPRPEGMEACHNNGKCLDDRKSNLRWDTKLNNENDKLLHGTRPKGSKVNTSKLNDSEVGEILELIAAGERVKDIAEMYDVTESAIRYYKVKV